jgi:hypothetical protein
MFILFYKKHYAGREPTVKETNGFLKILPLPQAVVYTLFE